MELKLVCGCGQKYVFDVEPVNGRMPMNIACPNCGADGTAAANEVLARSFPVPPPPIPATTAVAAPPAATTPSSPLMTIPVPETPTALRISRPAPAPVARETPGPLSPAPEVAAPAQSAAVAPVIPGPKAAGGYNLGLGIIGAILGAALGAGLMYGFFKLVDARFPLMGTCIGALAGLGARVLAKGAATILGAIAGAVALVSTAGTLYLMFGDMAGSFVVSMVVSVFFAYKIAG